MHRTWATRAAWWASAPSASRANSNRCRRPLPAGSAEVAALDAHWAAGHREHLVVAGAVAVGPERCVGGAQELQEALRLLGAATVAADEFAGHPPLVDFEARAQDVVDTEARGDIDEIEVERGGNDHDVVSF